IGIDNGIIVEFSPVIKNFLLNAHKTGSVHGDVRDEIEKVALVKELLNKVPENLQDELFSRLKPSYIEGYYISRYKSPTSEQINNYISYADEVGENGHFSGNDFFDHCDYFFGKNWSDILEGKKFLKKHGLALKRGDRLEALLNFLNIDWVNIHAGENFFEENGISRPEGEIRPLLEVFQTAGEDNNDNGRDLLKYFGQNSDVVEFKEQTHTGSRQYNQYKDNYTLAKRDAYSVQNLFQLAERRRLFFENDSDLWPDLLDYFNILHPGIGMNVFIGLLNGKWSAGKEKYLDGSLVEGQLVEVNRILSDLRSGEIQKIALLSRNQKEDCVKLKNIIEHRFWGLGTNLADVESGMVGKMVAFSEQFHITADYYGMKRMAERPDCAGLFYYLTNDEGKIYHENSSSFILKMIDLYDAGLPAEYFAKSPTTTILFDIGIEKLQDWDVQKIALVAKEAINRGVKMDLFDIVDFARYAGNLTEDFLEKAFTFLPYFNRLLPSHVIEGIGDVDLSVKLLDRMKILTPQVDDYNRQQLIAMLTPDMYDKFFSTDEKLIASVNKYLETASGKTTKEVAKKQEEEIRAEGIQKILIRYDEKTGVKKERIMSVLNMLATHDLQSNFWGDMDKIVDFACSASEKQLSELQTIFKVTSNFFTNDILTESVIPLLKAGKNAEEIIEEMDGIIGIHGERYSEAYNWTPFRNKGLEKQLAKKIHGAVPELIRYFGINGEEMFVFYQEILKLSERGFTNLESLAKVINYEYSSIKTKNLIQILEAPKFDLILEIIRSRLKTNDKQIRSESFWELMRADEVYLLDFCESVDEEIIARYSALDKYSYLHIHAEDAVVFLKDPSFPMMLEFAKVMREVFGEEFVITGRELLLMDVEGDLKNILKLKSGCYNKLDEEMLLAFSEQQDARLAMSARKILSVVDKGRTIELTDA
ncbi:hypothetical protein KKC87_00085, partial [Patescibacteria group bacterium]|nr:hypothetical protein [Patescibacteria group bacterium]